MISKEDALRGSKMSLDEMKQEFPKMSMLLDYMHKHYPDNFQELGSNKMIGLIIMDTERHVDVLKELIDKVAIANGFTKWGPLS
jgi:hypothetical protein